MICSMCEKEVKAVPYKLIDTIPHHNGHTQNICKECKDAIGDINSGDFHIIDMSEDYKQNPLQVERR